MHGDATPAQLEIAEGHQRRGGPRASGGHHPPRGDNLPCRCPTSTGIGGVKRLERIGGFSGQRASGVKRGKVHRSGVRGYPGSHQDEKAQGCARWRSLGDSGWLSFPDPGGSV